MMLGFRRDGLGSDLDTIDDDRNDGFGRL